MHSSRVWCRSSITKPDLHNRISKSSFAAVWTNSVIRGWESFEIKVQTLCLLYRQQLSFFRDGYRVSQYLAGETCTYTLIEQPARVRLWSSIVVGILPWCPNKYSWISQWMVKNNTNIDRICVKNIPSLRSPMFDAWARHHCGIGKEFLLRPL